MPLTPNDHLFVKPLVGDTDAAQIAARLVANPFDAGSIYEVGSAIRISANLYITAKHVLEDYLERFGHTNNHMPAQLWACHVHPGPNYAIWQVDRFWMPKETDLAVFHTRAYNDFASSQLRVPAVRIDAFFPKQGERVVSFGYKRSTPTVTKNVDGGIQIDLKAEPSVSIGTVVEVLPKGRGDRNVAFPCFRFSGQTVGGMSGGPIFNDQGEVCGLVSYSLEEQPGIHEDYVSYGSLLWPLLTIEIDVDPSGQVADKPYPLMKLAESGLLSVAGYENVKLHYSDEGRVCGCTYKL